MEDNKKEQEEKESGKNELEEIKEMLELYFIKSEQHLRKIKNRLLVFMLVFIAFAIIVVLSFIF